MTCWLSDDEFKKYRQVDDIEINELLCEVNKKTNNNFLIKERVFVVKKLFRKPQPKILYEMFCVRLDSEVMVVNFCTERESSINTYVPKSYIITYLLGILTGLNHKARNNDTL